LSAAFRFTIASLVLSVIARVACAAPEAGYASAEQAFEAVFLASGIGQRGYEENREYAAALYQMPDGRWYATQVVAGSVTGCDIPYHAVPAAAIRIAGAHTHGQPRLPGDPSHIYGVDFSQTDRRNAIRAYQTSQGKVDSQLLLTSRLEVLRMSIGLNYDPSSARIAVMAHTTRLGRS
jgi:hypothetical protein